MNLVDWILVGALIVFAFTGWHRGFITGLLSFVGFLGGGLLAAFILPPIIEAILPTEALRVVALVFGVVMCAVVGQVLATMVGNRVRGFISWTPARVVDNVGGAALNVMALAVVVWIIASAVVYLPSSPLSRQVTGSRVLVALDSIVPEQARNAFGALRDLVGTSSVPRIFSGIGSITGPDVPEPSASAVTSEVDAVRDSVVKIIGEAVACENVIGGSGFAVAPDRVVTNAHVVAGVTDPTVRVHAGDPPLQGTVVYFDPEIDVAVIDVPGLDAPPLAVDARIAASGESVAIAGFPDLGPFSVVPGRIRTNVSAQGDDIYGNAGVLREVYAIRGTVAPGSSGGPLLGTDGRVLGMVFGGDPAQDEMVYALTSSDLAGALDAVATATQAADTGSCRIRD